jgi:16S rRNA (guanine966-N2)-methyltransferase
VARRAEGTLRLIGGEYRSRQVQFDPDSGVRPTPDRVRQTLFDWLAPVIDGARCADLFAGSGALGLEALSRGAAHVTFVETGRTQAERIGAALAMLHAQARALVHFGDALGFIEQTADRFDIVFLDPPYDSGLLAPTFARLPRVLKPEHRIFLEWSSDRAPPLPENLRLLREKQAGQVSYGLAAFGEMPRMAFRGGETISHGGLG